MKADRNDKIKECQCLSSTVFKGKHIEVGRTAVNSIVGLLMFGVTRLYCSTESQWERGSGGERGKEMARGPLIKFSQLSRLGQEFVKRLKGYSQNQGQIKNHKWNP